MHEDESSFRKRPGRPAKGNASQNPQSGRYFRGYFTAPPGSITLRGKRSPELSHHPQRDHGKGWVTAKLLLIFWHPHKRRRPGEGGFEKIGPFLNLGSSPTK